MTHLEDDETRHVCELPESAIAVTSVEDWLDLAKSSAECRANFLEVLVVDATLAD